MSLYLYMRQKGEGCDYTIGCAQKLVALKAETIEAALAEVPEVFEYYGIGGEEKKLEEATLLELKQDVMPLVFDIEVRREGERQEATRAEKKRQLEKLKRELGE